jgi:hypothetical protein
MKLPDQLQQRIIQQMLKKENKISILVILMIQSKIQEYCISPQVYS